MRASLLVLLLTPAFCAAQLYKNPAAPVDDRVEDLLSRMTLDEKVSLLGGTDRRSLPANPRLGIPALRMTEEPLGANGDRATAFPAGIALAATFDPELVGRVAAAIGEETLALGRDMLLGPSVNIARNPRGGRNFESFGEDPYLAARMAAAYVSGVQSRRVLACVKRFGLDDQEPDRKTVDAHVSEVAEHEIYLPAFEAAVRAGVWSVMAADSKVDGRYATENESLLTDVLKMNWGFAGFVVSEWGATHSTVAAANAGLDVEMPSGGFFSGGRLQAAVREGSIPLATIDDKARRVLRAMIGGGVFDRVDADRPSREIVGGAPHLALARTAAAEGMVLLKNDRMLPFPERLKSLAVIGPFADRYARGGGSSAVIPSAATATAWAGLRGAAADVRYARGAALPGMLDPIDASWLKPPRWHGSGPGLLAEYFANPDFRGKPALKRVDSSVDFSWDYGSPDARLDAGSFSVRWTGRLRAPVAGEYALTARGEGGASLWLDGRPSTGTVILKAGRAYDVRIEYAHRGGPARVQFGLPPSARRDLDRAVAAARGADAVVVVAGFGETLEGESRDRTSLSLPEGQDALIAAVSRVNRNVVVVLEAGSPVLMDPWLDRVRAVVMAWYPGERGGDALADVLLGRADPSGRLPVAFPRRKSDATASARAPLFPFGYGFSYARFDYSNLAVRALSSRVDAPDIAVSFDVRNAGARAGTAVPQLYLAPPTSRISRPTQELKGFARVTLGIGEARRVVLHLHQDAFAHYDPSAHAWEGRPGRFKFHIGESSRDARLEGVVDLR